MKFTRKKILEEKKENKRLKLGLGVLVFLFVIILVSLRVKVQIGSLFFWEEGTVKKPIAGENFQEKLVNLLAQKDIPVKDIKVLPDKTQVYLNNDIMVIFDQKNIEKQVTSLQLVLERFKIEGRKVSVIDLRFSKPVIK